MIWTNEIGYHNDDETDDGHTTVDERNTQIDTSIALAITKYVLLKIVDGQSVGNLTKKFDNDAIFVDGIIEFLIDMGWMEYDHTRGSYQMTEIGEKVALMKKIVWI